MGKKTVEISFSGTAEIDEDVLAGHLSSGAATVSKTPAKKGKGNDPEDEDEMTVETVMELIEDIGEDDAKKFLKDEKHIKGRKSIEDQLSDKDADELAEIYEALEEEFPDEGADGEVTVESVQEDCQKYQKKHGAKALKEILADYDIKTAKAVKDLEQDDLEGLAEDIADALDED